MKKNTLIPFARPSMGEEETAAASRVIASAWIGQGPEVAAFEKEFANYVGATHACAVTNCTSALQLALKAIGVGLNDQVITVSHSYIATANCVRSLGATPVFIDIDPNTFNIEPSLIEAAITKNTRAILCVHQMGMPCEIHTVLEIAKRHNLYVIEDAACGIGSEVFIGERWEKIGKPHGDIACFSFHPRKILSTGDGGMITTSNRDWDDKFRLLRQHGMNLNDLQRHSSSTPIFESYLDVGFNYRMTDLQAAIGREQLKRLPTLITKRRQLAEKYRDLLSDFSELILPVEPKWARSNWQSFAIRLPKYTHQKRFMQHLLDKGVATRRGVMCAHREPAYKEQTWLCGSGLNSCDSSQKPCTHLPESEVAQDRSVLLPLFHDLTIEQQTNIVAIIKNFLQYSKTDLKP